MLGLITMRAFLFGADMRVQQREKNIAEHVADVCLGLIRTHRGGGSSGHTHTRAAAEKHNNKRHPHHGGRGGAGHLLIET